MTNKKQNDEQQEELRDLDVPAEQAENVTGGSLIAADFHHREAAEPSRQEFPNVSGK